MVAEKEDDTEIQINEAAVAVEEEDDEENEKKCKIEFDELLQNYHEKYEGKVNKRDSLLNSDRSQKSKTKLDSSIKKNSAFVKKLATIKEAQLEALAKEIDGLNFGRYITEAADALAEGKFKLNDIGAVVTISSKLHLRYEEFSSCLFNSFKKKYTATKTSDDPVRLKIDMKLIADLTVSGIFSDKLGLSMIHHELKSLVEMDKNCHEYANILISICKNIGEDIFGFTPPRLRELCQKFGHEIPTLSVIEPKKQTHFVSLIEEYYEGLKTHLLDEHRTLKKMEKQNRSIYAQRGELHEERRMALVDQKDKTDNFKKMSDEISQFCDLPMVELPVDSISDQAMSIDIYHPEKGMEVEMDECWEDDDQRLFYTDFPDLKSLVPMNAWKDSEKVRGGKFASKKGSGNKGANKDSNKGERKAGNEINEEIEAQLQAELDGLGDDYDEENVDEIVEDDNSSAKEEFELYIKNLMTIYNRELVDEAAQEFLTNLNTPVNRKKISRELWKVDRRRIDLLPFYTRLAACLQECCPIIADDLSQYLIKDFRYHLKKKDQVHNEVKIKNARYIGEATKFGLIDRAQATSCFRILVLDFSIGAIEMICGLLESCGRFLYRNPDSHQKTKLLLDQLKKKKQAKALDPRLNSQLENAIYACNPPVTTAKEIEKQPPLEAYIDRLLFTDLSKKTVEIILKQFRKLDWKDNCTREYVIKALSSGHKMKYSVIHCAASVVSGLSRYQGDSTIEVVDNILEDIRATMEYPDPRWNQRRIAQIRYLGELYNYKMIDSSIIFSTLYSLLMFGVSPDPLTQFSPLDPPENLVRLRIISVLLDTCGCFFDRGSAKKKLDIFIQYFLRYFFWKKELFFLSGKDFPLGMDHSVRDVIENLRPRLKFPATLEECLVSVEKIEREATEKLEQMGLNNDGLGTMMEEDEDLTEGDEGDITEDDVTSDTGEEAEFKPEKIQCEEDDEFVKQFDTLMTSEQQTTAANKNADLNIPMNLKAKVEENQEKVEGKIVFSLITRKGNKTNAKALHVSEDSRLAIGLEKAEKERQKQKEEMRELTIAMANRLHLEEVQQEALGNLKSPTQNRNHERAKKYAHPKAPPNADVIFSAGGRRK